MKKKSGLADSPFFTPPQQETRETPGSSSLIFQRPDKPTQLSKTNINQSDEAYASRGAYEPHEARKVIRRPIQIYEDQFNRMRAVSARSVLEGKPQLLREIFQEAIEEYLQKRESKYPKR